MTLRSGNAVTYTNPGVASTNNCASSLCRLPSTGPWLVTDSISYCAANVSLSLSQCASAVCQLLAPNFINASKSSTVS